MTGALAQLRDPASENSLAVCYGLVHDLSFGADEGAQK